jgi:polysaccharide pyruvyl transferase WcaK-like protein
MASHAPTVAIIGASLWGNRGAEAMICATIGRIRAVFPTARCIVLSYFPKVDRQLVAAAGSAVEVASATPLALVLHFFPWSLVCAACRVVGLQWPRRLLPAPVRALAEADALLDVFGISYADGREKFLPFNLLSNLPAILMGVPLVKLAQGMGPYHGRLNRLCARLVLRRCARVFARGRLTYELTAALHIGGRLGTASDIAFCYTPSDSLTRENEDYAATLAADVAALRAGGCQVLTLSVSSVVFAKCRAQGIDYVCAMQHVIRELRARGLAVLLFPNATRADSDATRNNDLPVIAAIAAALPQDDPGVVAIDRDLNTQGLRAILAHTDYLVASRFHAMIAGLVAGIPTLVLGWGHKYREILDEFDLGEWAWDYSQLDPVRLLVRIDEFIAAAPELRERIRARRDSVVASAQSQFDWLNGFLRARVDNRAELPR